MFGRSGTHTNIIVVDIVVVVDVAVRIDDAGVVGIVSISRPQPPIGRILQPYPYM